MDTCSEIGLSDRQKELMSPWLNFDVDSIPDYLNGKLIPDCTTIQVAAKAGQLDFLKWCATNGYASEFHSPAAGAALVAGHKETFEWLIQSGLIKDYSHIISRMTELAPLAENAKVDMELFWSIGLPSLDQALMHIPKERLDTIMKQITPDMIAEFLKEHPEVGADKATQCLVIASLMFDELYSKYQ